MGGQVGKFESEVCGRPRTVAFLFKRVEENEVPPETFSIFSFAHSFVSEAYTRTLLLHVDVAVCVSI